DAVGRLTAKETAESRTEYIYDAADQLLEIRRQRSDAGETDAPEIIRFSYDRLGRMLTEETAQGVLTHQYDELSNRTATTFPDGRTQRHLYYGSGHLQQINLDREVISEFTRDALHREVLRSQGRLSTRQLYDPAGRLKRRETYSGMRGVVPETFTDRQYSYNGQDELLKTRHSRRGEKDYFYDPTGHITACRSEDEGYLASWQYDAAGNLLGRRAGERATAENSVVPFNRLLSYRGVHYRYDEHGRVVEKQGRSGTQSYRYDAEHRMVEVTTARETYRYVYDALGRRTEKQHISPDGKPYNRTKFLWDGMRLAKESRPEGISRLYIYSDQGSYEPLARVDKAGKEGPNRILYFHTDVNGAPEEMTDSDGKIVWETGYQVWGNTIQEKDHGRVEQNLRYQGQYLDRETGLHYNLHRYYDPDVGRFIVTDPIGLLGGINLYQYAPNPLGWIDPLGLKCGPMVKKVNGRNPSNSAYAGRIYPASKLPVDIRGKYPHGVPFNHAGFPDFSHYSIKNTRIELGSSRDIDFARADRAAGYGPGNPRPEGYTWHHHQDSGYMQLVPSDIHDAVRHTGGIATGRGN
ncbi:type IV secretion protein Rhs, partial [Escherichia coli]|nr:type IV secretion protein Rhs [Escherichia coli]